MLFSFYDHQVHKHIIECLTITRAVLMNRLIFLGLWNGLIRSIDTSKSFFFWPARIPFPKWMPHHVSKTPSPSHTSKFLNYTSKKKKKKEEKTSSIAHPVSSLGLFSSLSVLGGVISALFEKLVTCLNLTTKAFEPKLEGKLVGEIKAGFWVRTNLTVWIIFCFLGHPCI